MSREKTLNARFNGHSSSDKPLSRYINTFKESNLDRFLEALASFDPHDYNLNKLLKQFRAKRSRNRSRERRSGIPLMESIMEEKSYKEITNME
jgi:hypothetical protein